MENVNFISKNNFNGILSKFKVKNTNSKSYNNLSLNGHKKSSEMVASDENGPKKGILKKLEEMKLQHQNKLNENASEVKQESVNVFKKVNLLLMFQINDIISSSSKLEFHPPIKDDLKKPLDELKKKHLLIRDLFFIHQSIKNSTYSEDVKKNKKNNIKKISQEIHDGIVSYEKNESLNPIIKTNLQNFKEYINKIKGSN